MGGLLSIQPVKLEDRQAGVCRVVGGKTLGGGVSSYLLRSYRGTTVGVISWDCCESV